jgi:hypothetical protein
VWASTAGAATVTKTDDTAADFSGGTTSGTVVRSPGSVELARKLETTFDGAGPALPTGWTSTAWTVPPSNGTGNGTSTVGGGAVTVDGARLDSGVTAGPGSSLQFTATFGTAPFQHVGFATDFNVEPWAMFSTGSDATAIYARTTNGTTATTNEPVVTGAAATQPHTFRIDWTQTGFVYFVDGTQVASHPSAVASAMRPQASDLDAGGPTLSVASLALSTHVASGTFTSRVLDAGDGRVTAVTVTPTATTPTGTTLTYEARSGDTPEAVDAASYGPLGSLAAHRYVQYRATFGATNAEATPSLDKVDAAFTIDDQAPVVTIGAAQVNGTSATIPFSADDHAATFACSVDNAAFAACATPASLTGLSVGSHTLRVRATDAVGNASVVAERTFAIAPPTTGGGGTPPPSGGGGGAPPPSGGGGTQPPPTSGGQADHTAPKVVLSPRSVRVAKGGKVAFRIKCPRTETRCKVTLELKRGRTIVARKTVSIRGGETAKVTLRLRKSARTYLSTHARLKATAVTAARDAAGNRKTTRVKVTLRAPAS